MIRNFRSVALVLVSVVICGAVSGCQLSPSETSPAVVAGKPPFAQIRAPGPGEVIVGDVYHGMRGVAFDIADNQRLVVFASDRFNFFLMFPFPRSVSGNHVFEQNNIRLATTGDWELHVCCASSETARYLSNCARQGEWSFSDLPEGVSILDSVKVERQ